MCIVKGYIGGIFNVFFLFILLDIIYKVIIVIVVMGLMLILEWFIKGIGMDVSCSKDKFYDVFKFLIRKLKRSIEYLDLVFRKF